MPTKFNTKLIDSITADTTMRIGSNITTADINIGQSLTTGDVYIGNTQQSGGYLYLGSANTTTTINGLLQTSFGTISGKNSELSFDSANLPVELSSNISNINLFILLYGGATPTGNFIIPDTFPTGQTITIKSYSAWPIGITFTTYPFYPYGYKSGSSGVNTFTMQSGTTLVLKFITTQVARWYQINPSDNFPMATTGVKFLTSTLDALNSGVTGTTALAIGSNIIYGNIEIGNSQTIGDIRIGMNNTSDATITVGTTFTATTINGSTTINGTLIGPNGAICGRTNYINIDVSLGSVTLSTLVNNYCLVQFYNVGTITVTIPSGYSVGQRFSIKSISTSTTTLSFTNGIVILSSNTTTSSITMTSPNLVNIVYEGTKWIQI